MKEYYIKFYNGAVWSAGGIYNNLKEATHYYKNYIKCYGVGCAKLYELTTTAKRILL